MLGRFAFGVFTGIYKFEGFVNIELHFGVSGAWFQYIRPNVQGVEGSGWRALRGYRYFAFVFVGCCRLVAEIPGFRFLEMCMCRALRRGLGVVGFQGVFSAIVRGSDLSEGFVFDSKIVEFGFR